MEKQILICPNPQCRSRLNKTSSSFVKCAVCTSRFFSFCHQFPNTISEYVTCKQCPNQLYYFFCVKCKDTLCFKNYRMGSVSKCKCGFLGCYVVCNNCKHSKCYPPNSRYEGISWCCEKCKQPFNFMTCDQCFHPNYAKQFRQSDKVRCLNSKCKSNLSVKRCNMCQQIYLNSKNQLHCAHCEKKLNSENKRKRQNLNQEIKTPQMSRPAFENKQSMNLPTSKSQDVNKMKQPISTNTAKPKMQQSFGKIIQNLCKICLDKQANFINEKCFHISCCELCAPSMNKVCPICRTQGEFRKVFW